MQICNDAFEKLFQYGRSELLAKDLQELIATNELAPEAIEIWQRVTAGERVEAATKRRRKDGTIVDVELHGIPVFAGAKMIGVIAIYHDVSRRKGAELALHNLSARLLELQDEERRRIARELHDTTAQSIFALTMNLTRLQERAAKIARKFRRFSLRAFCLRNRAAKSCERSRIFSILRYSMTWVCSRQSVGMRADFLNAAESGSISIFLPNWSVFRLRLKLHSSVLSKRH